MANGALAVKLSRFAPYVILRIGCQNEHYGLICTVCYVIVDQSLFYCVGCTCGSLKGSDHFYKVV